MGVGWPSDGVLPLSRSLPPVPGCKIGRQGYMEQFMPIPPPERIADLEHVMQVFDYLLHTLRLQEAIVLTGAR